jgi:TRAP-type C4-dicarboxylate transport system permease large subunit
MHITTLFTPFIDSPFALLTIIMIFLLIAGMVMDLTPNILIFAPVFYPLIQAAGINDYHFGLLMVLNLGIGVITPPVGTVLYVVCGIGNIKLGELVSKMWPFVLMEVVILFLLTYFPQLSLAPLRWLMS